MTSPPSNSGAPPVRVLVVEDHPAVREGLVALLAQAGGCTVVGQTGTAGEALALAAATAPAVIVLDLVLHDTDGLALIKALGAQTSARVLVFSLQPEEVYAERCLRAGAGGYVMKTEPVATLYRAIRAVAAGEIFVGPRVTAAVLAGLHGAARPSAGELAPLTDRELQVFRLAGLALPTRDIATKLGVSVKTVEAHRENIKNKLGLQTHAELIARAAQWVGDPAGSRARP